MAGDRPARAAPSMRPQSSQCLAGVLQRSVPSVEGGHLLLRAQPLVVIGVMERGERAVRSAYYGGMRVG